MVYTDVWVSMGKEEEETQRMRGYVALRGDGEVVRGGKARRTVHALPAGPRRRGSEQAVLDNPRSIIFDQAENRLHMQKAILAALTEKTRDLNFVTADGRRLTQIGYGTG